MFNITDIRVNRINSRGVEIVAIASLVIDDCLRFGEIIVKRGPNGYFLEYPQRGVSETEKLGYLMNGKEVDSLTRVKKYVYNPLNKETSQMIEDMIFSRLL